MRVSFRLGASADVERNFRYYLMEANNPSVAIHFQDEVRAAISFISKYPFAGTPYLLSDRDIPNLRGWALKRFSAFRFYYLTASDEIEIVRLLHAKQNIRGIIRSEIT